MKKHYTKALACFLLFFTIADQLRAQTSIPLNTPAKQDFNAMAAGLTLPANWKISAAGAGATTTWATGLSSVTQAANTGSPTTGGAYNWGTTAGAGRAVGFLTSGSYASPNAVMAYFRNTTGALVTTLTISFNVERYRINTSDFSLGFFSSVDGTAWTARNAGDISAGIFAAGASSYTFDTPATVTKTVTLSGLNIANNADIYFRWLFTDAVAANAQGLGLDDVTVYAGTPTPVVAATLKYTLKTDTPPTNQANSGDELTYRTAIKNLGTGDATGVVLTEPAPTNTTFVGGSVKTSTMARDETFTTPFNTQLSGGNVITNDYGIPTPAVISFGPTANPAATLAGGAGNSNNGGAVVVNANGTFTYTPATDFSGQDQFGYIAGNGNLPDNDAVVTVTVGSAAVANADSYNVVGNVSISPNSVTGILSNDTGGGLLVSAVNGNAANVGAAMVTGGGGNLTVNANGSFTYDPAPGFTGSDSFTYTADNGFSMSTGATTVTLNVAGVVWFVNNNAVSNGDGRLSSPFKLITNVTGTAAGQTIFLYESATAYSGSITLLATQKLIGQDASQSLETITGLTPNATYSAQFPSMNSGNGTVVSMTATNANIITLNSGNTVRGMTVGNAGTGKKITGSSFGTLTLGNAATPDVILNGTGQALDLQTGTLAGGLTSLATTSSATQGVLIQSVAGTYNFGPTTVSGSTSQGILISLSSSIIPTFGVTTVSAGTDGVSIQGNTGNVTFSSLGITTTNGVGLLGTNNTGQIIVTNNTSGISATGGAAISLSQASGTSTVNLNFSGLTSTGGTNGVLLNNISGTIAGGTGSLTANGTAFSVAGGSATVTYGGTLTHSAASTYMADIKNTTGGSITLSGNLTATGSSQGINVNATTATAVTFSGAKSLTTGANTAVTLSTNGTSNIAFSGGDLSITTTSGTGMNVTGGAGSVEVTGFGNTILTTSGMCLNIANTNAGSNGIIFSLLSTTTGQLTNITTSTGPKTFGIVRQTGANGSTTNNAMTLDNAGTVQLAQAAVSNITTTTGTGLRIANGTQLSITNDGFNIKTTTGIGIHIAGATLAAGNSALSVVTTGGTGVQATEGGTAVITGTQNTISTPGGTAINVNTGTANFAFSNVSASGGTGSAITYNAGDGTTTIEGGTITGNASVAPFFVSGGSANITYKGDISQADNAELLRIQSGHTGVVTFNTGTLSASNGTGLQFNNADGNYNFNGTTTLNGEFGGIAIFNGSSGTFTFGTGTSIIKANGEGGAAFRLTSSNAIVTYNGSMNLGPNTGQLVNIDGHAAGNITFNTGDLIKASSLTSGAGISIVGVTGGTVTFNNPTISIAKLNSGHAIFLGSNTGGTINFTPAGGGSGMDLSTVISGDGINAVTGGTISITGTGNTIVSGAGTALNLTNTTIGASGLTFQSIIATGTYGINLTNVTGTGPIAINGGTIDGGAAPAFNVSGGSGSVTYSGSVSQATAGQPLVSISGGNTGTITFNTGTLSATNGTGLQFDNADGTYNFNGTTTLNGGDAAVDILNGSAGTFTFGTTTALTSPAGNAFNVDGTLTGNTCTITYSGNITQANNFAMVNVKDHSVGTITFQTGTLSATNGSGLQFDNADGTYNFNGTTTLNGGDAGIDILNGSNGTFSFSSNTSVTNPTGIAININTSSAGNITYSGTFSKSSTGIGIQVNAKTGGTVAFNGSGTKTLSTTTSAAVSLTGNTGGTINFSGNNLVLTTTSGTGFNATGGGTISVTGTGNTINSTSGATALNVTNTTIGANGLTFLSITSTGGTEPGIVLNSSGAGGLTVTGDGGGSNNGSGGSITNKTGSYIATGAFGAGTGSGTPGVRLINASNVRLKYMNITGNNHSGIFGGNPGSGGIQPFTASSNGFQLVRCNITGNGNETNSNPDETGIDMYNLSGTAIGGANPTSIDNCVISNNWEFEVQITNAAGTLTDFQINNSTISSNGSTGGHGNLVNFLALGTATMTITAVGGSYTGAAPNTATAIHVDASSNGSNVTANISGATFTNNNAATSVSTSLGGVATFNIANNTATGNRSHGMNVFASANGPFTSLISGKFLNNTIGTLGVVNSGSEVGSGIRIQNEGAVPVNIQISGNIIQEITSFQGITVNVGLSGVATGGQNTNLTITNNTIRNINGSRAMAIQDNQTTPNTPAPTLCTNISGNVMSNVVGQAGDGSYIRLRRLNGTFNVTQASLAALEAANTCAGGSCAGLVPVSGTVNYNQAACTLPNN